MLDAIVISAAQFPTVVVYLMDTVRSTNPVTFMSNMLYACSILYKTKLPFIVAMNKTDVVDNKYAVEWMEDFEIFQVTIRTLLFIDLIYSFHLKQYFWDVFIFTTLSLIGSLAIRKVVRFKPCTINVFSIG